MFKWIKWIIAGKPTVDYLGFHCGCCGKWVNELFAIPEYQSSGRWWDTWGLCNECKKGEINVV